jgi:hypothetical protein
MAKLITGQKLAVFWMLALVFETVLALRTFKTRLATDGMSAERALVRGSAWEAAHLLLLGVVIPGVFLFITWRYLGQVRLERWSAPRILLTWSALAITLYLAMMLETAVTETILPLSVNTVVRGVYGVCVALAAGTLVLTLKWLRARSMRG